MRFLLVILGLVMGGLWLVDPVTAQHGQNRVATAGQGMAGAVQAGNVPAGGAQVAKEKFKSGLWAIHTTLTTSAGGQRSENDGALCRDQSYDMAKIWQSLTKDAAQDGCTMTPTTTETGKMVVAMECSQQGMHSTGKMTMAQLDEEHMHVEMQMTLSGSAGGRAVSNEISMTEDLTYKGPCPQDMAPGDQRDADGTIHHETPSK